MGPADGAPVMLWHGFPELGYSWRTQAAALADAGYRAIVPDMRSYGKSDRPEGTEHYAFSLLVGDVVGLIEGLGLEATHLAGHDWGGSLCWATSALRPDVVRSLFILNSATPGGQRRVAGRQRHHRPAGLHARDDGVGQRGACVRHGGG